MDKDLASSIEPQLACACAVLERHLAPHIVAIHLFGSAVDGGLRPHSDIDLLVTVDAPPDASARQALMRELLDVSAYPGASASLRALEVTVLALADVVPWRYPARRQMQFGEWLRDDIRAGVIEAPMLDHDLAILLAKVRAHSAAIRGPAAQALFAPVPREDLVRALLDTVAQWNTPQDWAGDERNIVLALARGWYTAATGGIAPKDAAATWLLERIAPEHRPVLRMARAGYLGQAADGLDRCPDAVAGFIACARGEIERICAA